MDKILLMLQLQNRLNDATNGEEWVNGTTKNGKTINWRRCIYMEAAEMIESFPWKHWKSIDAQPDWENLKIEIVDVWHFVMSLAIEYYHDKGTLEDLAITVSELEAFGKIDNNEEHYGTPNEVMEKVEDLMRTALEKERLDLEALLKNFFELVLLGGLNLSTLYKLYIGKNILNRFRQDNGYKEGSYIKIWNGEEDNAVMQRILDENPSISPEALYKELQTRYPRQND